MRRNFGKRGVMSLENEDTNPPVDGGEELGAAEQSLETDLVEIAEDGAEADTEDAEIEEAVDTAEALEALAEDLKVIAQEAGGLNSHTAQAIGRVASHLYGRLGYEHQSMPAMESFGSTSGRVGSTTIGLEDIKDQVKKIWEQIVAQIKKSIEWVKNFFTKMFGAANKLEKRAKALASRAESSTGGAGKPIENERLAKALHIGGAVPASISAKVADMKKLADGVFAANRVKLGEDIASALENGSAEEMGKVSDDTNIPGTEKVANPEAEGFTAPNAGMAIYRSGELPGGMAVIGIGIDANATPEQARDALGRMTARVSAYKPSAKAEAKKELPALAPAEAGKVAEIVAEIAIVLQGYKASLDKLSKAKDRIIKAAEKLGRAAATEQDEQKKGDQKDMQRLAASSARLLDQPATDYCRYSLQTGTALLNYVELSLKASEAK